MNSSMPDPETYPKKPRSTRKKWYAVIIVLILLLSSLSLLSILHPEKPAPDISVNTAPNYLQAGSNYTILLKANEPYKTLTIFWGDNNKTTLNYTQDMVAISHTYISPGVYYIHYMANFSSGTRQFNTYIPVYVESSSAGNRTANGMLAILSTTKQPVIPNSNILQGNTTADISIGNSSSPANSTFKILNQTLYIYKNGSLDSIYSSNNTDKLTVYGGYYTLKLSTITGNGTGKNSTTYYYMDIPVNPSGKIYINTISDSIVLDSLTPYANLNPQEAYTGSDLEILYNIEQFLVGRSSSGYYPEIASSLPSHGNGINGNSYTFHINNRIKFQNGNPVTAYDVYYSLVMDLMLENKEPQTPGWVLAQYLLPGNYHDTNNYSNIMKAVTYSNSTQTVTLNFNQNLQPGTVFSILSSPGAFISSASYLTLHGENITWSSSGFKYFEQSNNTYTMPTAISNGPYEIASYSPGRYITLIRNPYFVGTANNSVPTINSVTISYRSQISSIYQDLRLNTSQLAVFPDTYTYTSYLKTVMPYNYSYNLSVIYNFNSNVNITLLGKYVDNTNFPPDIFSNITVREAFWEAYPGHNLTLAKQLWHSFISNSTDQKKFNLTSSAKYHGKSLVMPIFTEPLVGGSNLSIFDHNLTAMIGNSSSFPIVSEPMSFINKYENSGMNPMPLYEKPILESMNSSIYYNYLGNTMNYTHAYNNGFSYYQFNISDKNQSIIMAHLNANISKLSMMYNKTNILETKSLLDSMYMYINASRTIGMKLYMQNYITSDNNAISSQGIIFFNRLSL